MPELHPISLGPLPRTPRVSVLISNYNYGDYIGEAIQSTLEQTYQNFELIVCDDGSTDNSLETIDYYATHDNRIRVIPKANGGQASGFNAAFSISTGDIICLLDSDDVYASEKLQEVVGAAQANPNAGFIVHRVVTVNQRRRRQGVLPLSAHLPDGWFGDELLKEAGIVPFMPPTSGLALRREVAAALFPLPVTGSLGACPDQVIMRLAPCITCIAGIDKPLAEYRLHGKNAYATARLTAKSVERELTLNNQLWRAQKKFLEGIDPQLSARLEPAEKTAYGLLLRYIHSRLAQLSGTRAWHAAYLKALAQNWRTAHQWFWRRSLWLPGPVFAIAVNLLMRQNRLKQIVAHLKGFL